MHVQSLGTGPVVRDACNWSLDFYFFEFSHFPLGVAAAIGYVRLRLFKGACFCLLSAMFAIKVLLDLFKEGTCRVHRAHMGGVVAALFPQRAQLLRLEKARR